MYSIPSELLIHRFEQAKSGCDYLKITLTEKIHKNPQINCARLLSALEKLEGLANTSAEYSKQNPPKLTFVIPSLFLTELNICPKTVADFTCF
ncbi:hypothetical protein HMPREF9184_01177 [Streptococcus sp. oral taxon 058 str. F0407]|nr:hypothetical protein HMPREF9184_01177 [Streptococcus sp. oral taxon 058 str. F0407]